MGIAQSLMEVLGGYLNALDWTYILTFIIISYGFNHPDIKAKLTRITGIKTKTRFRVAIIGILYGILLYFIKGQQIEYVEVLFTSFIFAFAFHKLIFESLIRFVGYDKEKKVIQDVEE